MRKLILEEENPPWMKEAMTSAELEVVVPAVPLGNENNNNVSESRGDQPYSESQ